MNFAPGIWLIHFPTNATDASRTDCSGDYNQSFVYMLIAQFNYFIWPFIVLCVLNMLIMINIWKRSRKMSRLMTVTTCGKSKDENASSSLLPTGREADEEERSTMLSKHRRHSNERCPSIILEENEHIPPGDTSVTSRTTQPTVVQHKTKCLSIAPDYPMMAMYEAFELKLFSSMFAVRCLEGTVQRLARG